MVVGEVEIWNGVSPLPSCQSWYHKSVVVVYSRPRVLKRPLCQSGLAIEALHSMGSCGEQDNGVLGLVDGHAVLLLQNLQVLDYRAAHGSLPDQPPVRGAPCSNAVAHCADNRVLLMARPEMARPVGLRGEVLAPYEGAVLGVNGPDGVVLRGRVEEGCLGARIRFLEEGGLVFRQA
jgi:hypothetical protein